MSSLAEAKSESITLVQVTPTLRLNVVQDPSSGIAYQLWPSATILANYLSTSNIVKGKAVLELGSGCGLVGLSAAAFGARSVILTDRPDALEHTQRNAAANVTESVACEPLAWGGGLPSELQKSFDLVLLSDCTYWQHLHERLLETLEEAVDEDTVVLLAHQWRRREVEQGFFDALSERGWGWKVVRECDADDVIVVEMRKRGGGEKQETRTEEDERAALLDRLRLLEADLESIEAER
ncbi:hypothetical protein TeGR_g2412 [Tetraparma gracilis]|jgi:predicted nicotinamide N-methyase|uniref:Methyltransferase-domain-containing protein n=1 Tax=Tetraparma gracilis TaxID=2962635 RepID=A0ABQ6N1S8_9STRA|nr:hypothetical protein TeGR_g2412 [Tetraparma gracilis]